MVRKRQGTIEWSLASKGTGYRPFQQSADVRFEVREGPKGLQAEKVERI
jgi:cold shock CspA family protein